MLVIVIPCTRNSLQSDLESLESCICCSPETSKLLNVTVLWLYFGKKYGGGITQILEFSAAFILCHSMICVLMRNVMEKKVKVEEVEKTIQVFRIMFAVSVQKLKTNHRLFSQTGLSLQTLFNFFSMQFLQLLCLSPKAEGKQPSAFVCLCLFLCPASPAL